MKLKGKITKKYSLDPIEPGLEIDLIPNVALDIMSKEQRETADCRMELEILTRDEKTQGWSNASVLLRLSRKEIEKLYDGLKEEYDSIFLTTNTGYGLSFKTDYIPKVNIEYGKKYEIQYVKSFLP